jgi:AcrR family transcriptional regulator
MARTQAADYEERRTGIVEKAAKLYSERGFLGASINDLARVCKTSKSLIYHYYPSKEDILFDVMHSHVATLQVTAQTVLSLGLEPNATLRAITLEFMKHYVGAAERQKVLLNELHHLPKERRTIIVGIQNKLIDIVQDILGKLRPDLAKSAGRYALLRDDQLDAHMDGSLGARQAAEDCGAFCKCFSQWLSRRHYTAVIQPAKPLKIAEFVVNVSCLAI